MATTQRVTVGEARTWTVLDADYRLVEPVEQYLEYLRNGEYAPNTVKSYARALALWWTFLETRRLEWTRAQLKDFGSFMRAVRTGTVDSNIVPFSEVHAVSDATLASRVRAVMSFYRYHTDNGVQVAESLYAQTRFPNRSYLPLLEHVARRKGRIRSRLRVRVRRTELPLVFPEQVKRLLEHEASYDPTSGAWRGDLRYRLLWAFLAETGARLGEALSVRHGDWVMSRGGTPYVELRPGFHPHGLSHKSGGRQVYISTALDRLYGDYVCALCDMGADIAIDDWEGAFVFVNLMREPRFAPLRPESVYAHLRAVKRRGLALPANMTPHWFRHTHATALLLSGTPLHVVSRRLGHSDVQTTINTYGHVTEDAELAALGNWKAFAGGWGVAAHADVSR